ncbi:hypothetical protein ACPXCG_03680 [Gordonia sp. DT218]|uniref:hypothetical protein n=1 Tax=unclassified Gordonia (in: high G+C Gram-positive bacteria) TaxID=2657482 RepID=UPI003CFB2A5B
MAQHPSAERDFDPGAGSAASGPTFSPGAGSAASGPTFSPGAGSAASGPMFTTENATRDMPLYGLGAGSAAAEHTLTDDEQAAAAHRRQILSYLGFTLVLIVALIVLLLNM